MKKLLFALTLIALSTTLFAQKEQTLLNGRGLRLTGAWGGSQLGATDLNGDLTGMRTGFGGIELNKNWFVGYLVAKTDENRRFDEVNGSNFKLDYHGLMLGVHPMSYRTVHPTISVTAGRGRLGFVNNTTEADRIYLVQPQAGLEINVTRWFRLGLEGGYRFLIDSDLPDLSDETLSGAYGQMSFKFGWSWGKARNFVGTSER
jgi:hypothetical protein